MARDGFTRRDFVRASIAATGLAAGAASPLGCVPSSENPFEGIYTGRFTYRVGEPVHVYAAIQTPGVVELTLRRNDRPDQVIDVIPILPSSKGNTWRPGVRGAGFELACTIPTDALEPGIYQVSVPREALLPENQRTLYHRHPSDNWYQRFVVTDPAPGSRSRLLWVHDSLTATCYGSYGGESIYGGAGILVPTVSWRRPGLTRTTNQFASLRFYQDMGYEFEYIDVLALHQAPDGYLDNYDLIIISGQFEYLSHSVMAHLDTYLDGGGNLFVASNEFGIFRTRLDEQRGMLTTFKDDYELSDPLFDSGDPANDAHVAGIGMTLTGSIPETAICGQTVWAAYQPFPISPHLPIYGRPEVEWILEGTGLEGGGTLIDAIPDFASGTLMDFDEAGLPNPMYTNLSQTDPNTIVWAALASPEAKAWFHSPGQPIENWITFPGYATATYLTRASGAQVVTLPTQAIPQRHIGDPVYDRLLLNIVNGLSTRA
jgi:hypothetical protein